MSHSEKILLTGATGYVGGRLLARLESLGKSVRCMARTPEYLKPRVGEETEVVAGDALDFESLEGVFEGVITAYYLIHSMGSNGAFEDADRKAAENFSRAAKDAGVQRIIYLGGLGDSAQELSAHLKSRQETGKVLSESGVPTLEFRASIVIGAGSLSFEMIRSLVQKLPIMTTPKWVYVQAQPIAISDLLDYLTQALDVDLDGSEIYEIGGSDVVTYADLMQEYAQQRGLKRRIIPVPFLTPKLSSLWLGLVTPLFARIGKKLIDSLRHPTIVRDHSAREVFDVTPKGASAAIKEALEEESQGFITSRWSDSVSIGDSSPQWGGVRFGTRLVDARSVTVATSTENAFAPIQRIGGESGWYFATWLWQLRGALDLLIGGVGMRRGRRHPTEILPGDVLDFWRVERFEPNQLLRLKAEMKLPGRAWLELEVKEVDGETTIHQTAIFDPVGLGGLLYWYGVYPLHQIIFSGMLRALERKALEESSK